MWPSLPPQPPPPSRPRLPHTAFNYFAYYCVLLLDQKKTTKKQGRTHYTLRNEEPESVATGPAEGAAAFTGSEIHKQRSGGEVYNAAVSHSLVGIVSQGWLFPIVHRDLRERHSRDKVLATKRWRCSAPLRLFSSLHHLPSFPRPDDGTRAECFFILARTSGLGRYKGPSPLWAPSGVFTR